MSRVGGVGGQQNSCVRKKSRRSETSDVLFYVRDIYSHGTCFVSARWCGATLRTGPLARRCPNL